MPRQTLNASDLKNDSRVVEFVLLHIDQHYNCDMDEYIPMLKGIGTWCSLPQEQFACLTRAVTMRGDLRILTRVQYESEGPESLSVEVLVKLGQQLIADDLVRSEKAKEAARKRKAAAAEKKKRDQVRDKGKKFQMLKTLAEELGVNIQDNHSDK